MNIPYVKRFDENGKLKNPIVGTYSTEGENRSQRRGKIKGQRFFGNGKNHPLTVMKTAKYLRYRQIIVKSDGRKKTIEHYVIV